MVKAMEKALGNLVGNSSGFLESLPRPVKARISYLEELQDEYNRLEEELEEQMKELELKYKPFFGRLGIAQQFFLMSSLFMFSFSHLLFCVQTNYIRKERRLYVGKKMCLRILMPRKLLRKTAKEMMRKAKRQQGFQISGS